MRSVLNLFKGYLQILNFLLEVAGPSRFLGAGMGPDPGRWPASAAPGSQQIVQRVGRVLLQGRQHVAVGRKRQADGRMAQPLLSDAHGDGAHQDEPGDSNDRPVLGWQRVRLLEAPRAHDRRRL